MPRLPGVILLALGLTVAGGLLLPRHLAAGEPRKAGRDARQVAEAYLAAVQAGKADDAAALAVPGSVEGSRKRIAQYQELLGKKPIKVASAHASAKDGKGIAVTHDVQLTKAQRDGRTKGPLIIKLSTEGGRWLVRDVDFKSDEVAKQQVKQFLQRYPDARPVPGNPAKP